MRRSLRMLVVLAALFVLGCGGDDVASIKPHTHQAPNSSPFDMTGRWFAMGGRCQSHIAGASQERFAELNKPIEAGILDDLEIRIVRMGNDLVFTNPTSGVRYEGTISGDQIHYVRSAKKRIAGIGMDASIDAKGTILTADWIAPLVVAEWTLQGPDEYYTGMTICAALMKRSKQSGE